MSLRARLLKIERELDTLDPDSQRYRELDAEANLIAAEIDAAEIAYAKQQAERELQRREQELKIRIGEKFGDYEEWYRWALSLYTITDDFRVISNARNWNDTMEWTCGDKISCLEKIEQLIIYKEYDHFKRARA